MNIVSAERKITTVLAREHPDLAPHLQRLYEDVKCTYLTYMLETPDHLLYVTSHPDWAETFISDQLINACPIYHNAFAALETHDSIITIWDAVPHKKGIERDIQDHRTSFNIAHGVGMGLCAGQHRESLVFAGGKDDVFFYERVNSAMIHLMLAKFRACSDQVHHGTAVD